MSGKISRRDYVANLDDLYVTMDRREQSKVNFRKDRRSLGQYAIEILDNTRREQYLVHAWVDLMVEREEFAHLSVKDYGTDNSGRLIIESDSSMTKADYKVTAFGGSLLPDGTYGLEVKFCPTLIKNTYKVQQIKRYIRDNAYMLVIMSSNQVGPSGDWEKDEIFYIDPKSTRWMVVSPQKMELMLKRTVSNRPEMGGKPSLQFNSSEIVDFFEVYDWSPR
jgi:hypothetical protein